ncbi:hypothetical protein NA655_08950 [Pseudomonas kuykendallii]|uniref:Uncharacterized protein n=1 Tax=Pseudomonas kuykendallii TaxID=1007099 RepID=A0A1H3EDX1_9PSED|nr:hypothetical protein [Pseudomonas kuykendallii]MCQ4271147.1 hypothetical protein [Pseudomonas kuykendallii]SDX76923.1 hypothetical protein SAMN05216287_3672 [Pseudomonas kuykendallii]
MSFAASIYDLDTMNSAVAKINHVQLTSFKKILRSVVTLVSTSTSREINQTQKIGKPDIGRESNQSKNS